MGPLLLFDKSLLNHLTTEEIDELSRSFLIVSTPTLVREIIADLQPNKPVDYVPEQMVRALARKMGGAGAAHPANFRKLAIINLTCKRVPMEGQVPVDGDRPNIRALGDGFIYDKGPEQRVWERWENGQFDTRDQDSATAWRSGTERVNLKAVSENWKEWVNRDLGNPKTIPEIIGAVDHLMARQSIQRELLEILIDFLRLQRGPQFRPLLILLRHGVLLKTVAPYAASILRLYLTFVAGVAKGRIGARKSHVIDLQYLFYAPFCMVFSSEDRLHETLWPATSGVNMFIKVTDLKADLARRIRLRNDGVQTFQHGYPIALEDSVITAAMDRAFHPGWRERITRDDDDRMRPGTLIDDLPAEHRDRIRAAFKAFDAMPQGEANLLDDL